MSSSELKIVCFFKRKDGISHKELRDYYENIHAPLAVKHMGQWMGRYSRSHVRDDEKAKNFNLAATVPYDCITQLEFANEENMQNFLTYLAAHQYVFDEDEEHFMDRANRVGYLVREEVSTLPKA
jgi:hypothetical protein